MHPIHLPMPVRVKSVHRETHDTVSLRLDVSEHGLRFAPGQFMMLYAFGHGEVPISLSGDPANTNALQQTVRDVGTVTRALVGTKRGGVVGIRGPFGSAWPLEAARGGDLLIVAGGLGLAPLRPALLHALAERSRFGRLILLVGARTPEDLLFRRELQLWAADPRVELGVTVDRAPTGWAGQVGVVLGLLPELRLTPEQTTALVCGPEVMMRFTARALQEIGIAGERIHLSLERNMKCAIAQCGHCQLGPLFICREGPVIAWNQVSAWLHLPEV